MKVAVIGGGVAGCMAAYTLKKAGHQVSLFEKEPYLGGRTHTFRKDGICLDTGAGFFTNFYPQLKALLDELQLKEETSSLDRRSGLVHRNQIATLKVGSTLSFLRFPYLSTPEKLRMIAFTLGLSLDRSKRNLTEAAILQKDDDRSIAEDVRQQLGENIYQYLVRPSIEPFWYFSCEKVSRSLFRALGSRASDAKFFVFQHGIDRICQKLAANIACHLASPVSEIQLLTNGQLRVCFRHDDQQESADFDRLVIASTASTALRICQHLPENICPDWQKNFLASQEYVPNIHASFISRALSKKPAFSSMFPCGPGEFNVAALSFHSAKYPHLSQAKQELISVYLSEASSRALIEAQSSTSEIFQQCYAMGRDFHPELPPDAKPFHLAVRKEAIPLHAVGRYLSAAQFQEQQSPPLVFAGDYLSTATIDGALTSGVRAAETLLHSSA
ncbi:MAG: protoporphyrinogen/coproporphyrinogen oxidase [Oligoflexus sp.]